jgi:hypothetical protein
MSPVMSGAACSEAASEVDCAPAGEGRITARLRRRKLPWANLIYSSLDKGL